MIYSIMKQVLRLKPGQFFKVSGESISEIPTKHYKGYQWLPADQVLEGIPGSGYSFFYIEDMITGDVTFGRLVEDLSPESGLRSYVDPDQRDYFTLTSEGLFKSFERTQYDPAKHSHIDDVEEGDLIWWLGGLKESNAVDFPHVYERSTEELERLRAIFPEVLSAMNEKKGSRISP